MYMSIKPHFCDDEAEFNPLDVKLPMDELEYVMNEMEFTYDLLEIDTDNGPRVRTSFIFHPSFIDAYWLLERKDPRMAKEYIEWCKTDEGKQYLKGGSKYKESEDE